MMVEVEELPLLRDLLNLNFLPQGECVLEVCHLVLCFFCMHEVEYVWEVSIHIEINDLNMKSFF